MPTTGSVPLQQVIPGQLIASALWNNEFANVGNLLDFSGIGGYESTDAIMQIQTNPFPGSVTSHATSGAGEVERIRFMIAAITGNTYWYQTPLLNIVGISQTVIPVGAVFDYPSNADPTGVFHVCDGSALNRTTYSHLFALISTSFGIGDGATTFNLPNYTDRMSIGAGGSYAVGATGGSATSDASHSHTVNAHQHDLSGHTHTMHNHTHTGPSHTHNVSRDGWGSSVGVVSGRLVTAATSSQQATGDITSGAGGTGATSGPDNNTSDSPTPSLTGNTAPGTDVQLSSISVLNPYIGMYKMMRVL